MVKFGHYLLEAAAHAGIPPSDYFGYKMVKKAQIKKLIEAKEKSGHALPEQTYEFADVLAAQIEKIRAAIDRTAGELDSQLHEMIKAEQEASKDPDSPLDTEHFLQQANRMGEEFVRLSSFVAVNKLAIDKIIKKHDKHAALAFRDVFPFFLQERSLLHTTFFDAQILALSDFYAKLRGELIDKNVAVGTNFERQSIKYWVHPQDAMTVIMIIIQHLPVYSFKPSAEKGEFRRKCISDIKSTYYDNEKLTIYHRRIKREEGSSLIRVRWYDNRDAELFVERKIHHESWVKDASTKERFILPSKNIDSFIAGDHSADQFIEELRAKGRLGPEQLEQQRELFTEVQRRFSKYDLFPSVRTHYLRMAFQIPGDARVRMSLDLDVQMCTEWLCPAGHWRSERPDGELVYNFPYAIMEVKLQGAAEDQPQWIIDLMNCKFCEAVPKFSKFGHGTATLHPDRIGLKPYWFDQMDKDIESIYKPDRGTHLYREFRPPAKPSATKQPHSRVLGLPRSPRGSSRGGSGENISGSQDRSDDERSVEDGPASSTTPPLGGCTGGLHQRRGAGVGAARRTPWWLRTTEEVREVNEELDRTPEVAVPVRIEPKTYLANERTFLHWLSISSLVAMMALAIMRRPRAVPIHPLTFVVGSSAFMVAVLYMLYALSSFLNRNRLIAQGQPIRLDDNRGPVVLTLLLICVVVFGSLSQLGLIAPRHL